MTKIHCDVIITPTIIIKYTIENYLQACRSPSGVWRPFSQPPLLYSQSAKHLKTTEFIPMR